MARDQPYFRADMLTMTDAEAEQWIEGMRTRRMKIVEHHAEAQRLKGIAEHQSLQEKAAKIETRLIKALAAVDKQLEKAEKSASELKALRLQIEDSST